MSSIQTRTERWAAAENDVTVALRACLPQYTFEVLILDEGVGPILDVHTEASLPDNHLHLVDCIVSALGWRGWGYTSSGIAFKPTTVPLE